MQTKAAWELIDLGMKLGVEQFLSEYSRLGNPGSEDGMHVAMEVKDKIGLTNEEMITTLEKLDLLGARGVVRYWSPRIDSGEGATVWAELLRSVVESESERIQVFTLSPTRLDSKKLLNDVSALFAPRVFESLHEVAQYDFAEAGKCILYERPTSAAFHLMRGTEAVLRQFYQAITGKNSGKKFWGPIVEELQSIDPSLKPLYDHLDNIRDNFRNPTQHPDKIYSIDEAQDLFGVCIDVVDQMIPIILRHKD